MSTYTIQTDAWWGAGGWTSQRQLAYDTVRERYWAVYRHQVNSDFGIYAAYSDDDGANWTEEEIVIISGQAQNDCSIAIDSEGNLHVAVVGLGHGSYPAKLNVVYYERIAATDTWQTKVAITDADEHHYAPAIGVDGSDNVHLVWTYATWTHTMYKKRTSGSWGSAETVAAWDGTSKTIMGSDASIAVDSDGVVHVVFYQKVNYVYHIHYRKRSAAGSWDSVVQITSGTALQWHACIALDPSGYPHIAWVGDGYGVNIYKYQPAYIYETAEGWQAIISFTDTTVDNGDASIAVDTNGDIHVTWFKSAAGTYHIAKTNGSWGSVEYVSGGQSGTLLWGLYNIPVEGYGFGDYWAPNQSVRFNIVDIEWEAAKPKSFAYVIG